MSCAGSRVGVEAKTVGPRSPLKGVECARSDASGDAEGPCTSSSVRRERGDGDEDGDDTREEALLDDCKAVRMSVQLSEVDNGDKGVAFASSNEDAGGYRRGDDWKYGDETAAEAEDDGNDADARYMMTNQ